MGYSGIGKQKWISNLKPRKPFSTDRKPSGNMVDKQHGNRNFSVHRKAQWETNARNDMARRIITIVVIIIIIVSSIIYINKLPAKKSKSDAIYARKKIEKEDKAYFFLIKTAKYYFKKNHTKKALNDFKAAFKLKPYDYTSRLGMAQCYSKMSKQHKSACKPGIILLNKMIAKSTSNIELYELRSEIYFANGDVEKGKNDLATIKRIKKSAINKY